MNSPMSVMKFPAFQMALLLTVMNASFGGQPVAPTNLMLDGNLVSTPAPNAKTVFNCSASNFLDDRRTGSTAACAVGLLGVNPPNGFVVTGNPYTVENGVVYLSDAANGGGHIGVGMTFQQQVNVQAFTTTFTFIPNGKNIAFVLQNDTSNHYGVGLNGRGFSAGAGCEAGFFQAFDVEPVNNIFALELDSVSPLSADAPWPFTLTYSNAQIYSTRQSPCIPRYSPSWTNQTPAQTVPNKISTFPVPLNSPVDVYYTTTGHTYSATIAYDGSNVTLNLYDMTTGGACPGTSCFSHTWTGINIPALVGANSAWVGITGGCNSDCPARLNVKSFTYATK